MKKTMLVLSALSMLSFSNVAAADEQLFQTICATIKSNDKNMLRKTMDSQKLKIRNVFEGLKCNGQDMIQFAVANNAHDVAIMIIKQLPKQVITEGKYLDKVQATASPELIEAVKSRTE